MQHALRHRDRFALAFTERAIAVCVTTLVIALIVCVILARPFHLPDEGRYAAVAWEMLGRSNWMIPRLDGLPYFEKPPLYYWLAASAMQVFGPNEFAARLPSLLGAAAAGLALFDLCGRWVGVDRARWIVVTWFATPLTFLAMQFANMDMLVAGLVTWSTCSLADAALRLRAALPYRSTLVRAYVAAALGVLAKGLIGAVLPALVIVVWLVSQRRASDIKSLVNWVGVLVFAAIALPWFVAMQLSFTDFAHYFIVVQHVQRFATSGFNNTQPLWFYPAVLAGFSLPWLVWFVRVHRMVRRTPNAAAGDIDDPLRSLMLIWLVTILVFFSIPESKLIGYIIPASPPIAYFVGSVLAASAARKSWPSVASVVVSIVTSTAIVTGFAWHDHKVDRPAGLLLAKYRIPGEPVVMLEDYRFDIPFYANVREPVVYVADWSSPDVSTQDNVRRELSNAGAFAGDLRDAVLVEPKHLSHLLCAVPVTWVIAPADAAARYPQLNKASAVRASPGLRLWRIDSTEPSVHGLLNCEKPSRGGKPSSQ